ncbi:MAG: C4-dicarboxylate ABC transporter [Paracoccaceae bacterium]|nr:MAG: C4-dicarboxylate ABC transporter [Paracoccaceae bacterium]
MQLFARPRRAYGALLSALGLFAGILVFAVMLLVVANVIMRFLFNAPIAGTLELTESALPLIVFLSLAFTQMRDGHIRVVVITRHLGPVWRRALAAAGLICGAALFAWAAHAGWLMSVKSLAIGELERGSIRFPLWPVKFAVFLGLALLAIQFAIDAIALAVAGGRGGSTAGDAS